MSRDKLVPVGQEKKPSCMLFCSYHQYCSASFVCAWVGEAVLNNILGGAFGLTYLCQNATYVCIFFLFALHSNLVLEKMGFMLLEENNLMICIRSAARSIDVFKELHIESRKSFLFIRNQSTFKLLDKLLSFPFMTGRQRKRRFFLIYSKISIFLPVDDNTGVTLLGLPHPQTRPLQTYCKPHRTSKPPSSPHGTMAMATQSAGLP